MFAALYRWAYLLCVYSGLRAAFNRARSRAGRGGSAVSRLHGATIRPRGPGAMRVFVHRGPRPRAARPGPTFGMISVRLENPCVGRLLYRYLGLTSHFGCGHFEIAFYESGGRVTVFAVRNVLRANADRLGWRDVSRRLGSPAFDVEVVRAVVMQLERAGLTVRCAPAPECVELALDRRLVHPRSLRRTRDALERKYRRLPRALAPPPLAG